jgi:uncharacterized protein
MAGGDKNPLDNWVVPVVIGTLLGGFISGWLNGRLKVETGKGPRRSSVRQRWLMAFIGGGVHGVRSPALPEDAPQGRPSLEGRSCLSAAGHFMFAVFAGGYALAYFVRKIVELAGAEQWHLSHYL